LKVRILPVGPLFANCYILTCEEIKEAVIIDPGGDADYILREVKRLRVDVKAVINTHGHVDHIAADEPVIKATGAKLMIHEDDAAMLKSPARNLSLLGGVPLPPLKADRLLQDGDTVAFGSEALEVIHTPGHTPGGICLLADDIVFTGDTLFAKGIGRTDFPGGSYETLLRSIRERLLTLPDDTRVYPGHGPPTTIGQERLGNPYL